MMKASYNICEFGIIRSKEDYSDAASFPLEEKGGNGDNLEWHQVSLELLGLSVVVLGRVVVG